MKLCIFLFTACFLSIAAAASAQQKGYYSIGNNAEKLKIQPDNKVIDSFFGVNKGYYTVAINRKNLRKSLKEEKVNQRRIPEIKKGYYSIGNNARRPD
jgi:hypothetical protein